ncbi:KxYKxGKxW signal peptide domain-containing protein [Eupransor demetentiae]|uniref:Gram-positive cocci surface proteins LPxTG domain-containing protein n=1 Tax=Eupransor demetentiae TaxID=3109584 RepID=A0ABM9N4J2_9LACO|nr:hypothetical protein R54876_GBNLAHCA_00657 [Lactobacillaceae bacterium LMG 33000]
MNNTKMYKSGKAWVVAGAAAALAMAPAVAMNAANADSMRPDGTVKNADGSQTTTTTTTNADGSHDQTYTTVSPVVNAQEGAIDANDFTSGIHTININGSNFVDGQKTALAIMADRSSNFPDMYTSSSDANGRLKVWITTAAGDKDGANSEVKDASATASNPLVIEGTQAGVTGAAITFTPEAGKEYALHYEMDPISADLSGAGATNLPVWNKLIVGSEKTTVTTAHFPADKPVNPTPTPKPTPADDTPVTPANDTPVAPAAHKDSALPSTGVKAANNNNAGVIALGAAAVAASFGALSYKRKH